MRIDYKVEGLRELEQTLVRALPAKAAHKVVARALKKSAVPMMQTAKKYALAGDGSGALSEAITMWTESKSRSKRGGHFASVHLGPKRGMKKALSRYYAYYGKRPTVLGLKRGIYHGHIVEFGSRSQPARPFLRPAHAAHGKQVILGFGKILGKEIEREAARQARKSKRK